MNAVEPQTSAAKTATPTWQDNLLPLMRRTLIALACFFFIASCLQLMYLNQRILNAPVIDVDKAASLPAPTPQQTFDQSLAASRLKALIVLEAGSTADQYHQANVLLAGRLWTTYLGFVTGMILAFVGASFVLGKLQEETSELTAKTGNVDVSFKSASPGLVLSVLGVILMVCTILTHNNIEVSHKATYLGDTITPPLAPADAIPKTVTTPPPLVIPKPATLKQPAKPDPAKPSLPPLP